MSSLLGAGSPVLLSLALHSRLLMVPTRPVASLASLNLVLVVVPRLVTPIGMALYL